MMRLVIKGPVSLIGDKLIPSLPTITALLDSFNEIIHAVLTRIGMNKIILYPNFLKGLCRGSILFILTLAD